MDRLKVEIALGITGLLMSATVGIAFAIVIEDRIKKYPHLGDGWIPMTEEQRRIAALPKKYTGR